MEINSTRQRIRESVPFICNIYINGSFNSTLERIHTGGEEKVLSYRGPRQAKDIYGWEPPNDFERYLWSFDRGAPDGSYTSQDAGKCTYHYNGKNYLFDSNFVMANAPNGTLAPTKTLVDADNVAMSREALHQAQLEAYADINGPDCPGLVWIAEGRETVTWFKDIYKGVLKAIVSYKAKMKVLRNVVDPKRKADQASSAWLQFRYAITPLALQVEEAVELLKEKNKELVTSTGFVKGKEMTTRQVIESSLNWAWHLETVRTTTISYRGAAKLYPSALKPEVDYGVQPYDALIAYWNIVKLSFVIDWFVSVGSFLEAYRPGEAEIAHQSNTLIYDACITNKCRVVGTHSAVTNWKHGPEVTHERINVVKRTTEVEKPLLPVFTSEALSLTRQIDAVALLYVFLKAFKK